MKIPKFGSINGHASLLPKWRGASPIQRSIEAGDKETGCTSMLMEKGLDTGPILFQKKLKINEHDDSIVIHDKLSKLTSVCLFETIIKVCKWNNSTLNSGSNPSILCKQTSKT